jgi:hypothetical protein
MLGGRVAQGPRAYHHRVGGCPKESHDEAVGLIESADLAASGLSRNFETDHPVKGAYEVAYDIGPTCTSRESKVPAIEFLQLVGQNISILREVAIKQSRDLFH